MGHLTRDEGRPPEHLSLSTLQRLVDRSAAAHIPLQEYADHWVVPQDEMPEGGEDVLEAAAIALLVGAQDRDHPLTPDEDVGRLKSLDRYSLGTCAEEPEICWRPDHLTLRVHRVH